MGAVEQLVGPLLNYGALGVICIAEALAIAQLYRAKEAAAREFREQMRVMTERHITKAETYAEKGNEIATKLNAALEAIAKRRSP